MGYTAVAQKLAEGGTVLLDGGVGSEIVRRTRRWVRNEIEASPDVVRRVHRDYVDAGADVVTANTFGLTRHGFVNFFHDLEHMREIGLPGLEGRAVELAGRAVRLAREARREAGAEDRVAIAGSVSPLNHPFRSDLAPGAEEARREHAETARVLADAGVDLLLIETMNTRREAEAAVEAARKTGLPVWVALVPNRRGRTLGGDPLEETAAALARLGPDAILVNCAPPDHLDRALEAMGDVAGAAGGHGAGTAGRTFPGSPHGPVRGAYALIGRYAPPSWKMDFYPRFIDTDDSAPEAYGERARRWVEAGARIVGGCCGTTPEHVRAVAAVLAA